MKNYCVYMHTFPNNKKYIGISSDVQNRFRSGKGYSSQEKIWNAIKHYGWDNIKHEILIDKLTKEQAEKIEALLIQSFDSIENGYNTAIGGDKINATYLNAHILLMIRESKRIDKKYGQKQKNDDIVSLAEKSKYSKEDAYLFNRADDLIESTYDEYKSYCGQNPLCDLAAMRIDCYWWTMAQLVSNNISILKNNDYPYQRVLCDDFFHS